MNLCLFGVQSDYFSLVGNPWLISAAILVLGLLPCGVVCLRAEAADRLVALELVNLLFVFLVVLLAEGFNRPSLYDIALAAVLLSFPSTMVFAHFLECWL